jgi:hypothetical protein
LAHNPVQLKDLYHGGPSWRQVVIQLATGAQGTDGQAAMALVNLPGVLLWEPGSWVLAEQAGDIGMQGALVGLGDEQRVAALPSHAVTPSRLGMQSIGGEEDAVYIQFLHERQRRGAFMAFPS